MSERYSSFLRTFLSFILFMILTCAVPASAHAEEDGPVSGNSGDIIITELMVKNHATVQDPDGDFPDWIELYNNSGVDLNLEGWSLSDRRSKDGLVFPAFLLPADAYFVVFASGKDRPAELHTPFSLSVGEELFLRTPDGEVVARLCCPDLLSDRSYARQDDGSFTECLYPTPWYENTTSSYDELQDQLTISGPLQINEVLVSDPNDRFSAYDGSDWVELKNISSEEISLKGWYLSDDEDDYRKAPLPSLTLQPGALTVIRCDQIGLALNSANESLFLWRNGSGLVDWLALRDIPYGGSYGRVSGQNGSFFFEAASPNEENQNGRRRVSAVPVALTPDGFFDGGEKVILDLKAAGKIYYTFDTTYPTPASLLWVGPTVIPATCVIRAVAYEKNALPSRPITLNYFIGESFSLPVLSLVSDDKVGFYGMYNSGWKDPECSGNIALYDADGPCFSVPCGISMHGDTSLILSKKNMSIRFRGSYGPDELNYDIFGGGVTSFTNLVIRGGQDQNASIMRNELCENLALTASDNIIGSRSRYCILFLDGKYSGIYALSEKMNEAHYARLAGVSRNSVTTVESEVPRDHDLYTDVFQFCMSHDMSEPENYAHIESLMDLDSLIDWVFIEGFFANKDLTFGNLRFCRSSENDGRWRFMFYDLDAALSEPYQNHAILLHRNNVQCVQVSGLFADLWNNADFQDRFLSRAAELLNGSLSNKKVLDEIDRLKAQLAPEVPRNAALSNHTYKDWEAAVEDLRAFVIKYDWARFNVDSICKQLHLSEDVREKYFG